MEIRAIAHLGRFKDIVAILAKYGFDEIVERIGVPGRRVLERMHLADPTLTSWERVRLAMEELGPTFIKFGQILSLRPDLIPPELIRELRKLQDEVPAESFEAVRLVVEKEYGRPLDEVFEVFDADPISAGSLAQVHRARPCGWSMFVAVKVQRPGIEEVVATDLDILGRIARKLERSVEAAKAYNLPGILRQIRRSLMSELDFSREGRNMLLMRGLIGLEPGFRVPDAFLELTTRRVLVMELVHGRKLKDIDLSTLPDREGLATLGLSMTVRQILLEGFFHADPHPGNLLISDDGTMHLLDWGMVGRLTPEVRYELIDMLRAFAEDDPSEAVDILLGFTLGAERANRRVLENEVLELMGLFKGVPLKMVSIGGFMLDLTSAMREQGLVISSDLAIMIKALVTSEGIARLLNPDLNVMREVEPLVRRLYQERVKPNNLWSFFRRNIRYFLRFQREAPERLLDIVHKIDRGDLQIRFRHENLNSIESTLELIINRLVLGTLAGAFVLASSLIFATDAGPRLGEYPALGVLGCIVAGFLGLWLFINILRSRNF